MLSGVVSIFGVLIDFPPVTGTYLRITRMLTSVIAVYITPVILLLLLFSLIIPTVPLIIGQADTEEPL